MRENIIQMVESWLQLHGYDGLYKPGYDDSDDACGCWIGDLVVCGEPVLEGSAPCQPGYRHADGLMYSEKEDAG
jgi:hypothetical protein